MANTPRLFRVVLQVSDMKKGVAFYSKLLGQKGRPIHGSRHYFDCGSVILALLDPTGGDTKARPLPDTIYFSVKNLSAVHERARKLRCLSKEDVHGESGGKIAKRPWGERSFYADDPFGNGLCFVATETEFTGK